MGVLWPPAQPRLSRPGAPDSWSLRAVVEDCLGPADGARWTLRSEHPWLHVKPDGIPTPDQGWKLRVSGTVLSARQILARVLPVLARAPAEFKVPVDLSVLEWMCSNVCPREMAGKFVTIYPPDDATCGELASRLDRALDGIEGPAVLSDLPYRPGSLVSCRYGAFSRRHVLGPKGSIRFALRAPDGTLTEDHRRAWFDPPAWAPPPPPGFARPAPAEAGPAGPAQQVVLGDRFAVTGAFRFTGRGGIYQATDLKSGALVVVKQARPHMGAARDGLDSRSFLLHEWSVLHLLAGTGITPAPVALLQQDQDLFVAEEFLSGTRMDRWAQPYQPGPGPAGEHAGFAAVVTRLCEVVAEFHARGLVVRDLAPDNVFVDGTQVRVCDVEYVAFSGTRPRPMGTPGFVAPEVRGQAVADPRADLYALGALLFTLCTGLPPFFADDEDEAPDHPDAPDGRSGRGRSRGRAGRLAAVLAQYRGAAPLLDAMTGVIVALLDDDPAARPSAAEAATRLRRCLGTGGAAAVAAGGSSPGTQAAEHARTLISDISGYLAAQWSPGQPRPWPFIEYGRPERPLDIYMGAAGVLGVLARAAAAGYPGLDQVVDEAAGWLKDQHQPDGTDRQGLYLGNCGIAWGLALAATRGAQPRHDGPGGPGRTELAGAVLSRLRAARAAPPGDDDLLYGFAGTVLGHAGILQASTGLGLTAAEHHELQAALAGLARDLRQRTAAAGQAAAAGRSRPNYGFAHGLAGIGYALLAAGNTLADDELTGEAATIAGEIMTARIGPADQAWWPDDQAPSWRHAAHWCNGSSGIGTFLLRLWHTTGDDAALTTCAGAARAVLAARPGAQTCSCHGLAGDGEFFLDLAAGTGDPGYATAAWAIAEQLWALRARHAGRWLIPDETGERLGADYGNGLSGVLAFLVRLCHGGPRLWMADAAAGYPSFVTDPA